MLALVLLWGGAWYFLRRWREIRRALEARDEAERAVKQLAGLLPICSGCKKIRNDGAWIDIESYIREHSEVTFSYSLCAECMDRLYPEIRRRRRSTAGGSAAE